MSLFQRLLSTNDDLAPLALRLGLGLMILPHGLQKLFGWFGGYGFSGTMGFFTETLGIPWIFGVAAIAAESLGGLALLLGLTTRLAAVAIGITMGVAALVVHWPHGFFMNWGGTQQGEGLEFFVLAVPMAVALVLAGGGRLSLDRRLAALAR